MSTPPVLPILGLAVLLAACDSPSDSGRAGPAASVLVVSGAQQTATVGTRLPLPLVVRVTDARGRPVANLPVAFTVRSGGGSVAADPRTGADGQVQARWTLGTVARDTQRLEAAVQGANGQPVLAWFTAVGAADAPASVTPVGPPAVTAEAGAGVPVSVRVRDRYGNPVPAAAVVWLVQTGGGAVAPPSSATDTGGVAGALWTLGLRVDSAQALLASASMTLSTTFTASPLPPAGAQLVRVSGDAQTARSGSALAQPLVVRFQSAAGQPIRGAMVTWTTPSGTLTPPSAPTDLQGLASASWNPGTATGVTSATASVTGAAPVTFTAQVDAGPAASLQKLSGDNQVVEAGSTLPQPISVRVLDAAGNPVPGEPVRWRLTSGGTATPSASVTDAGGVASMVWRLAGVIGQETASAEVGGVAPVTFTATGTRPPLQLYIPLPGSRVGDTVSVLVGVSAPEEVTGVRVAFAGRSFELTYRSGWRGLLDLTGLPRGPVVIVMESRGANGVIASRGATLLHDAAPSVAIEAPSGESVATPLIRVRGTCADDDPGGCARILVRVGSTVLASGGSPFDADVSLAAFDGQRVILQLVGVDSAGNSTAVSRAVHVEASPRWTRVAEVAGPLMDADATRLLYVDSAGSGAALRLRVRATGESEVVFQDPQRCIREGYLAPAGALLVDGVLAGEVCGAPTMLRDWRPGGAQTVGYPIYYPVRVAGGWAAWTERYPTDQRPSPDRVVRRDLTAGTNQEVTLFGYRGSHDVSENGDVVYANYHYRIYRYRAGVTTAVSDTTRYSVYLAPVTDGGNVLFANWATPYQLLLAAPGDSASVLYTTTSVPQNYGAEDGWIAYARLGPSGIYQVWRRAPDGTATQLTATAGHSRLVALGPAGELVGVTASRRFANRPRSAVVDVGGDHGKPIWIDGQLHVMLGNALFRVDY